MDCPHPPTCCYTGFYEPAVTPPKPYRTLRDKLEDQMWIGCCACGEMVRQAPAALRDEAAWRESQARKTA